MSSDREILNIDEAAEFLGVSVKTFNKVLHTQKIPARKVGREWKFSRRALIEWVGNGSSEAFYKDHNGSDGRRAPGARPTATGRSGNWRLELD